ncbi:PREDICTED: uncharacterized protein LOC109163579 [Ipomoea nil]|uniref:uncharacterized protein LOC109163579 n=1 Tax=Ipomoea nil TaxID=35883 RepID=UPI000901787B|nr:PREDICTED: uncharacterized protein LOC109163579 [Ipomoea nil]
MVGVAIKNRVPVMETDGDAKGSGFAMQLRTAGSGIGVASRLDGSSGAGFYTKKMMNEAKLNGPVTLPITQSIIIDIPILNDDNHKEWKDAILLNLGILGFDYALRIEKLAELTAKNTEEQKTLYERWATTNRLGVFLIKSKIAREIRGPVDDIEDIEPLLKAIDDQFADANKSLASTLIMQFINTRLSTIKGTRKHILQLRDIAAQLKKLKIILPDAFVVHFALNTLSQEYSAFKISYNTHKDE